MKRICLIVSLMIVLFGSVLVLDTYRATRTVQAQVDPNAPAAPHNTYLPLISLSVPVPTPTPTPPSRIKKYSGIHMGNRGKDTDWPLTAFALISTDTVEGIWPAATVIQSAQLYNFKRDTASPCRIQSASIRLSNVYTYLTHALQNGTQLVIRITPSPGNFSDYLQSGKNHTLLTGETAAGGNYCKPSQPGELSQDDKVHGYRDIGDIVQEMDLIWHLNDSNRWPQAQIFFEPANEPNTEWYSNKGDITAPQLQRSPAWIQMDDYFSNLYDKAHAQNKHLQILTPPMSQHNFAEIISLESCDPMEVDNIKWKAGYDFMPKTYNSDRFEGYSWHNYWNYGEEKLDVVNIAYCNRYPDSTPQTHHIFQYFPDWLRNKIVDARKPTFITEADLNSPCQGTGNSLSSKVLQWEDTKNSLHDFIENETLATYVIGWLLVQEDDGAATNCADHNYEIYWHEAYHEPKANTDPAGYNAWFSEWWLKAAQ